MMVSRLPRGWPAAIALVIIGTSILLTMQSGWDDLWNLIRAVRTEVERWREALKKPEIAS
jgi:hypothetical protein